MVYLMNEIDPLLLLRLSRVFAADSNKFKVIYDYLTKLEIIGGYLMIYMILLIEVVFTFVSFGGLQP